jgi:hypothetical protein
MSTPSFIEIEGRRSDGQCGRCLAISMRMASIACISPTGPAIRRVFIERYPLKRPAAQSREIMLPWTL